MSLIKNEDGSYTIDATKLDVKIDSNQIWKSQTVKAILADADSSFRTKMKNGVLYSSWGIPVPPKDLNTLEQFEFYNETDVNNICAVITNCIVNEDNEVVLTFKPGGAKGYLLEKFIEVGNLPKFSMRAIGNVSYDKEDTQIVSVEEIISFDVI